MRNLRIMGLAVVAVFAIGAFAASSAMALPEFGQCYEKAGTGKYSNAGCTTKAKPLGTGNFEWRKAAAIPQPERRVAGVAGASILKTSIPVCEPSKVNVKECPINEEKNEYEATFRLSVECTREINLGEIAPTSASKELKSVFVRFNNCTALGGAVACGNTGLTGEIRVNLLKGKLGFINKAATPREVGLLLEPQVKGEFAKFDCGGFLETHVGAAKSTEFPAYLPAGGGDGIIAPITPVNTMSPSFTEVYSMNEAEGPEENENIPHKFEGTQPLRVLEDWFNNPAEPTKRSKWAKGGEATTNIEQGCEGTECESPTPWEIKAN